MSALAKRKLLLVQSEEFGGLSWGVMLLDGFMAFHLTEHLQLLCLRCELMFLTQQQLLKFLCMYLHVQKLQWVLETQPFCLLW